MFRVHRQGWTVRLEMALLPRTSLAPLTEPGLWARGGEAGKGLSFKKLEKKAVFADIVQVIPPLS